MNNFGVYKGRHDINLVPEVMAGERKPIILFGALNGSGKTTLVDALQLVLYGNSATQSNRGGLAYLSYLESVINKAADPKEGAAIELSMRIQRHQKDENIRLTRFWRKNGRGIKENFKVIRNGDVDTFATEHWDEVVEEIIPRGIAHLFFFDGERIEQLADSEHAAEIIETGLHTLLGLDLVDRLLTDLAFIEKRRKKNLLGKIESEKVKREESGLNLLQLEADKLYQKLGAENNKYQQLEKGLSLLREKYEKSGGKLLDSREALNVELKTSKERLNDFYGQLKNIAGKSSPLLLVQDLLDQAREQAFREEKLKQTKEMSRIFQNRDRSLLKYLRSNDVSEVIVGSFNEYLKNDRQKRFKKDGGDVFLNIPSKYLTQVSKEELDSVSNSIKALANKIHKTLHEMQILEQKISAVPDEEQLSGLIKEIDFTVQNIAKQSNSVNLIEKQYRSVRETLDKRKGELERLLEQSLEIDIANENNKRVLTHIKKVQETLKVFRRTVADKHINMLENLILESFQQLIRKSDLVREIKIEPETFRLILIDREGKSLNTKKLSAGERQLLAVAILWGLAKASGRPLPTIIDTPLGRLDTQHRDNLIKYYFPKASHQVILLSTDTEIIGEHYTKLKPVIKRSYQIDFDEQSESSHISSGYFI